MGQMSVASTAVSLVLHEYLAKYSTPEEAAKHSSEALVSMQHFEGSVKKTRTQRALKPEETATLKMKNQHIKSECNVL
jgi:transitional endoplasmic reticulum ATPase